MDDLLKSKTPFTSLTFVSKDKVSAGMRASVLLSKNRIKPVENATIILLSKLIKEITFFS